MLSRKSGLSVTASGRRFMHAGLTDEIASLYPVNGRSMTILSRSLSKCKYMTAFAKSQTTNGHPSYVNELRAHSESARIENRRTALSGGVLRTGARCPTPIDAEIRAITLNAGGFYLPFVISHLDTQWVGLKPTPTLYPLPASAIGARACSLGPPGLGLAAKPRRACPIRQRAAPPGHAARLPLLEPPG